MRVQKRIEAIAEASVAVALGYSQLRYVYTVKNTAGLRDYTVYWLGIPFLPRIIIIEFRYVPRNPRVTRRARTELGGGKQRQISSFHTSGQLY